MGGKIASCDLPTLFVMEGGYAVAEIEFRKAMEAEPGSAAAAFYLGYTYYKMAEPKRPFHPDKKKSAELFARPRHPYTRMLLDAIPDIHMSGRARNPVQGEVPNPLNPPSGCKSEFSAARKPALKAAASRCGRRC